MDSPSTLFVGKFANDDRHGRCNCDDDDENCNGDGDCTDEGGFKQMEVPSFTRFLHQGSCSRDELA